MPSRRRFVKREDLEDFMSASVTTLRSLQSLVEQHGGTFEAPRWTVIGSFGGTSGLYRRRLKAAGVITFTVSAAVSHNQVLRTARTFLTSADHVLVALLKESQGMRIHIQADGVEMALQGSYSAGDTRRLFDDAVKVKNAGKR